MIFNVFIMIFFDYHTTRKYAHRTCNEEMICQILRSKTQKTNELIKETARIKTRRRWSNDYDVHIWKTWAMIHRCRHDRLVMNESRRRPTESCANVRDGKKQWQKKCTAPQGKLRGTDSLSCGPGEENMERRCAPTHEGEHGMFKDDSEPTMHCDGHGNQK